MTKKKPSPQNRIWEKERRERLNKTFEDLHRLLPGYEPSSVLTKVEILQQTIEFIGKLQKKIKDLMQECNDPLKDQIHEQEKRLKRLLGRNEELVELLRKAKIAVPPCKYTMPKEEEGAEQMRQHGSEEKENGNRRKKSDAKRRRPSAAAKKQPVINQKHPTSHSGSTVGSEALALSGVNSLPVTANAPSVAVGNSCAGGVQSTPSSLALKNVNGLNIGPGNGVNVTPALLSTPIMTTSVLISNNGNLMQMPLVAPPSSLLIVGSEDVRAKLNLKSRPYGAGKGRPKRGKFVIKSIDVIPGRIVDGKIPIPPLRRSTSNEPHMRGSKMSKLKRKKPTDKGKQSRNVAVDGASSAGRAASNENGPTESKRAKCVEVLALAGADDEVQSRDNQQQPSARKEPPVVTGTDQPTTAVLLPESVEKTIHKEQEDKVVQLDSTNDHQGAHLEQLNHLNHPDLSEDIFANLQVPGDSNAHGSPDDGSLSPTAAYLMNFPLVAGGGKAAGNHIDAGDGDECDDGTTVAEMQAAKKDGSVSETVLATGGGSEATGSMLLDNFSSFFNYGQMETIGAGSVPTVGQEGASLLQPLPVASTSHIATVTTAVAPSSRESGFSNYNTTIYQSIDNMLDHRPNHRPAVGAAAKIPVTSSESDYAASVAFTFTLTSGTSTAATTTAQMGTMAANHFYGPSCGTLGTSAVVKPVVDDFSSPLKPSIEFTFSLTSTTGSQARTVQSQYTNSAILATTMTTPSYDTYGYYHKPVPQTANYCPSFGVLDPLLTTEKPATSFTFCLTSSTKTDPSYTQSSLAPLPTHTSQAYDSVPKLSTKHPQQPATDCYPPKTADRRPEKAAAQRSHGAGAHAASLRSDSHPDGMHQPTSQMQPQQQTQTGGSAVAVVATTTCVATSSSQQNAQSRYDVPWMAAGTHSEPVAGAANHHHPIQQQQQQQQQHQQPYELAPAQLMPSLEFPVPPANYSASYKSDIFFAHPPGEENSLAWSSPSKLSNILNDSSSPYFPPVTLPSLNGDLALNTSLGTGTGASSGSSYRATGAAKKAPPQTAVAPGGEGPTGSSFLSVSQLVNPPAKPQSSGHHGPSTSAAANGNCQQKPLNNNYSAEALIGSNSYGQNAVSLVPSVGPEPARKDKLFDYGGCTGGIIDGAFSSPAVPSSGALTFSFDTYGAPSGADFNKGYNFGPTQQNAYVPPPYGTDGGGYGGAAGGCAGTAGPSGGAAGLPYYGKPASQSYCYQPASVACSAATTYPHASAPASVAPTVGQDFTPYYLPTFGEKAAKQYHGAPQCTSAGTGKVKKSHKPTGTTTAAAASSASDFHAFPATVTSAAGGYSYASSLANTTPQDSTPQVEPHPAYPSYSHQPHQDQRSQQHHHYGSASAEPAPSTGGPYNYRQYSSSVKPSKPASHHERTHQEHHLHHTHHSAFPSVHGSSHQPHPQLEPLAACLNPPAATGYGNHHSHQPTPQGTASYGTTTGSPRDNRQQQQQQQQHNSSHHQHQHQHQQQHQQQHLPSMGHTASTGHVSAGASGCGTITNFNLSTICPEINDKTGRAGREDTREVSGAPPPVPLSVASLMTHW